MNEDDRIPFAPVLLLHDAKTHERVGVNGYWLSTFKETRKAGTILTMMSGETVSVEESIEQVAALFRR